MLLEALKQGIRGVNRLQVGTTVLTRVGLFHLSPKGVRDKLCPIADAQHREAPHEL